MTNAALRGTYGPGRYPDMAVRLPGVADTVIRQEGTAKPGATDKPGAARSAVTALSDAVAERQ